ncbi:MAG: RNB domain-containing ribonuclease [Candidatus Firestonebacteria bacterium]
MPTDREIMQRIARKAMLERGLQPDFTAQAFAELGKLDRESAVLEKGSRDLKGLFWASIDNDDSRDLDQLTAVEALDGGEVKIYVAVADVDSLVKKGSAIDEHARRNTTSVYTAGGNFPMLPEKLSTDLTSLNYGKDRNALIIEITAGVDGSLKNSTVYQGIVNNRAKLAYNSVAAWLDGKEEMPAGIKEVSGLEACLRLQDSTAARFKQKRRESGSLDFTTIEANAVFVEEKLSGLKEDEKNRAKEIIEEFMVAANGVIARFLSAKNFPSLRRIVRKPKRWEKIVLLAGEKGFRLPALPEPKALEEFLLKQKASDPVSFPDLSLAVIKLLGAGEYVAELPGDPPIGHFGLAVRDYTHSTAPNRRYPDLIAIRLLKAAATGRPCPYTKDELTSLANHCTLQEDAAKKVERQVGKSAAALLLKDMIGEKFSAIVTGASDKGTWVRLFEQPVEGRLIRGFERLEVGMRLSVRLVSTDVERGFIDLEKVR